MFCKKLASPRSARLTLLWMTVLKFKKGQNILKDFLVIWFHSCGGKIYKMPLDLKATLKDISLLWQIFKLLMTFSNLMSTRVQSIYIKTSLYFQERSINWLPKGCGIFILRFLINQRSLSPSKDYIKKIKEFQILSGPVLLSMNWYHSQLNVRANY